MRYKLWYHTKRTFHRTSWLGLIMLGVLFLAGATFTEPLDASPLAGTAKTNDAKNDAKKDRSVANVHISKKTDIRVITSGGVHYRLSKATMIVGEDGKQVKLVDMKVPCDAKITYSDVKGRKMALRIKITYTSSNANSQMEYEIPQ